MRAIIARKAIFEPPSRSKEAYLAVLPVHLRCSAVPVHPSAAGRCAASLEVGSLATLISSLASPGRCTISSRPARSNNDSTQEHLCRTFICLREGVCTRVARGSLRPNFGRAHATLIVSDPMAATTLHTSLSIIQPTYAVMLSVRRVCKTGS